MVQKLIVRKKTSRGKSVEVVAKVRGRPRAYDPDAALARATEAFWRLGYSGASVDQLSDATDMNRPSLYGAFGDKHSLYLKTLRRYIAEAGAAIEKALDYDRPLAEALQRFYDVALALYLPAGASARGCYLIGTAVTEAVTDTEVRSILREALRGFDRALEKRLQHAKQQGELHAAADPAALAMIVSAVLHTLAIRSRAGESRASLKEIAQAAIDLICNAAASR